MPNAPKDMIKRPDARPSRPSVKFTALAVAMMMKMKSGIYHIPRWRASMPGMGIMTESKPSLA